MDSLKKQRNKRVSLKRKDIQQHFARVTNDGGSGGKFLWKTIKLFISNKSCPKRQQIILNEKENMISDDREVADIMNDYFVNVVESTTGNRPSKLVDEVTCVDKDSVLKLIIEKYENHPSIQSIKSNIPSSAENFKFERTTRDSVSEIRRTLNKCSSVGFDNIPPKLVSLGVEEYRDLSLTS